MYAIVSLLEPVIYRRVEALWKRLETVCGLKGIQITPYPHFSWLVADDFDSKPLKQALEKINSISQPFQVRCAGLGIFTGPDPVIYIQVVKNPEMKQLHQLLWENIHRHAINLSPYYTPDVWVPHITLGHTDITPKKLACAVVELGFEPFTWEMKVDNLAVVCQVGNEVGRLEDRFDFSNKR